MEERQYELGKATKSLHTSQAARPLAIRVQQKYICLRSVRLVIQKAREYFFKTFKQTKRTISICILCSLPTQVSPSQA